MVAAIHNLQTHADEWTYDDACRFARQATAAVGPRALVLDLGGVSEVATAAFARLIELRRELLGAGGDLHVSRLHDQARARYELYHLQSVLPLMATTD